MSQSHSAGISATRPVEPFPGEVNSSPSNHQPPQLSGGVSVIDRDHLFADFKPLVQRLMRQYGTDPDLREELVGEIYFRFCALLDAYESSRGVPLRAYLVKQLSVSVYTYVRHHWRQHRREAAVDLSLEEINIGWLDDPTSAWIDSLFSQQVRAALPAALDDLPKRQSLVLRWRYYEERSFEDIATALHIQPATARSLLRHAVAGLRRRFADMRAAEAENSRPQHQSYHNASRHHAQDQTAKDSGRVARERNGAPVLPEVDPDSDVDEDDEFGLRTHGVVLRAGRE